MSKRTLLTSILLCLSLFASSITTSLPNMLEGRHIFEDIMGEYRNQKADGWTTADIAHNFKGVDFYKGEVKGTQIYAETAVSMKTTITTDVNVWLNSKPIQDNLRFLRHGLEKTDGLESNGYIMHITGSAEVHIYMPKEHITDELKREWHNKLDVIHPRIKFKLYNLEDFIKE